MAKRAPRITVRRETAGERGSRTTVCDRYFVYVESADNPPQLDVRVYIAAHQNRVRSFACWKTPRGWQLFLIEKGNGGPPPEHAERWLPGYDDVTRGRSPDIYGSVHPNEGELGLFQMTALCKTRGPNAPSAWELRHILCAVLGD